jgi:holo-[acyl-carrier protein] synthase
VEVIGIGTDLVDLDRFRLVMARTPGIIDRLFTEDERRYARARRDPVERFGARFAAKEATMKALGVGLGVVAFREIEVGRLPSGAPVLALSGAAATVAAGQGVERWLITLSHTGHLAQAVVMACGPGGGGPREELS